MNAEKTEPTFSERVFRTLQYKLQDAAKELGDPAQQSSHLDSYTFEQIEVYAHGVRDTLQLLAETWELDWPRLAIRDHINAALGERFRRLHPEKRFLKSVKLDRLLAKIRDLRIGLRNYQQFDYKTDYCPLRDKIQDLEYNGDTDQEGWWEEMNRVSAERRALWSLYHELIADKEWWAESYRRQEQAKSTTATTQPA